MELNEEFYSIPLGTFNVLLPVALGISSDLLRLNLTKLQY